MVVNFGTRKIKRDARKLARTFMLIIIIKKINPYFMASKAFDIVFRKCFFLI